MSLIKRIKSLIGIKLWYAVDSDGKKFLYENKPTRHNLHWEGELYDIPDFLESSLPEINWLHEPVLITLKLKY